MVQSYLPGGANVHNHVTHASLGTYGLTTVEHSDIHMHSYEQFWQLTVGLGYL